MRFFYWVGVICMIALLGKLITISDQLEWINADYNPMHIASSIASEPAKEPKEEDAKAENAEAKETTVPSEEGEHAAATDHPAGDPGAEKGENKDPIATTKAPEQVYSKPFTESEIELLNSLAERRKRLDQWEQDISTKEGVLAATELRIDSKIKEMQQLKRELTDLLSTYNQKEEEKINSLVRIYENMKPKDAARILTGLDFDVLLKVMGSMKEAKTALILAQMPAEKANDITLALAKQKILPPVPEAP